MAIKTKRHRWLGTMTAILALTALVATSAVAQQPSKVNPTESSVKEQQLLDALKPGAGAGAISGRVSIPDQRSSNLIRPGNQEWRAFHEGTQRTVGAVAIVGTLALLVLFFLVRGRIRVSSGWSGKMVTRFGGLDRFAHWLTAMSFIVLGISGLNLTFGKDLVRPLIGAVAFAELTQLGKFVHNYVSFAFALGLVLMFLFWVKDNFPHPRDIVWIAKGGGLIGKAHPPAGRFNGGQKLIFWAVILGGAGIAWSGYQLMFPFQFGDIAEMQFASMLHGLLALALIAIVIAHIYIGTLGMQGAFSAMGSGEVDLNWAKEHHSVWADKIAKSVKPVANPGPAE